MRKGYLAVLSAIVIGFSSCEKVKDAIPAITPNMASVKFTLPVVSQTTTETVLGTATITSAIDSIVRVASGNTVGVSTASSIKISALTVTLENPDADNKLSNLEYANVRFHSNSNTTPVEIGTENVSADYASSTLDITPASQPELKGYLTGTQLTYTISGKARKATTKPLNLSVVATLSIKL